MTRLLTLVLLGLAVAITPSLGEAISKRIHVTARVAQQTFIGDLASPRLGDRLINNVELLDETGTKVGTGGAACTTVSEPPLDTLEQCLLTAVFAEGQIMFGGVAPLPGVGAVAGFGILGGTDAFRKARGDVLLVVTPDETIDVTFDLDQPVWP
jgi:hypothetical protein